MVVLLLIALCNTGAVRVHGGGPDESTLRQAERLGELYSRALLNFTHPHAAVAKRRDRNIRKRPEVCSQWSVSPDFPCVRGVVPLGFDTAASIEDGHKFACGVAHISGNPIVYSFGSNRKQDFELSFLQHRPDAHVFTFDVLESHLPPQAQRSPLISYNAVGLGGWLDSSSTGSGAGSGGSALIWQPLTEIMRARNHSYIDVLKVDIEGGEWAWLQHEARLLDRVGQLLIEVHITCDAAASRRDGNGNGNGGGGRRGGGKPTGLRYPPGNFLRMLESIEARGLRLFYKELNPMWPESCAEFSLVRSEWGKWDTDKGLLPPLPLFVRGATAAAAAARPRRLE